MGNELAVGLDAYTRTFAQDGKIAFSDGPHGPVVVLNSLHGSACIALQGAQVLSWVPNGQRDVLWLSPEARPVPRRALRGGIPICWPWFGPHDSDTTLPAHGFVRGAAWQVQSAVASEGNLTLQLAYHTAGNHYDVWPFEAHLTLTVILGPTLSLRLETTNVGAVPFCFTQALHTYFAVADISGTFVDGLDGCDFLDKVGPETRRRQSGVIAIEGEIDRIYLRPPGDIVIVDAIGRRRIRIAGSGTHSCVVWNPWIEKGARLGDMGQDGYRRMICIETANAASDAVNLTVGARHRIGAVYSVES